MTDPYLTAKETAAELNISVATLYRLIKSGQMPGPVKLGACARWPRSFIEAAKKAAQERAAA